MNKIITSRDPLVNRILRNKKISSILPEPARPFYNELDDGAWEGQRCFIIGGGASLIGFEFDRLQGERTIAVNASFLKVPFADICFFMDALEFYKWITTGILGEKEKKAFEDFPGYKVLLDLRQMREYEGVFSLNSSSVMKYGLSRSMRHGLFHGNNSGYGALQLAICLGADPIYLLGFDLKYKKGKTHFHSLYPQRRPEQVFINLRHGFEHLSGLLKGKDIHIINLNMDSGLKGFKKEDPENILSSESLSKPKTRPGECPSI